MNKIYVVGLGPGAGDQMTVQAKKVLDAGLKMRHKSPSRQRVAPTGPRKKTFAKMKKTC